MEKINLTSKDNNRYRNLRIARSDSEHQFPCRISEEDQHLHEDMKTPALHHLKGILYGMISAVICPPVEISFAAIIFKDAAFAPFIGQLSKIVLISSLVHQLCFSIWSSMPFAIGQVQDAGLIFLSAMASSLNQTCRSQGCTDEELLATVCILLPLSTCLLGMMLIVIGRMQLASLVHYLPMPVIGGYLAFIGFFCGEAGFSMMANVEVSGIQDWHKFCNKQSIILIAPGLIAGLVILCMARRVRHMATLPVSMFSIIGIFYLAVMLTGTSIQELRDFGWLSLEDRPVFLQDSWKFVSFEKVQWRLASQLFPLWTAMVLVVAFSSSLDVAAIEMEARTPFDYNKELQMVGLSNVCSGLTGGFTGSYIFSQSLFNLRMGVNSRAAGVTVLLVELVIVILPISPLAYVPKCFFGSLLVMIAADLISEWLIAARLKMTKSEYCVALFTFTAIQLFGVETGMVIGVLGAMLAFIVVYSGIKNIKISPLMHSSVLRTFEAQSLLAKHCSNHIVVSFGGYVFFGTGVKILNEVKQWLLTIENDDAKENLSAGSVNYNSVSRERSQSPNRRPRVLSFEYHIDIRYASWAGSAMQNVTVEPASSSSVDEVQGSPKAYHYLKRWAVMSGRNLTPHGSQMRSLLSLKWLVLDFTQVTGIDATAARVCFFMLKQHLDIRGIQVIFAALKLEILALLQTHMVIGSQDHVFPTIDKALEWIEENTLERVSFEVCDTTPTTKLDSYHKMSHKLRKRDISQSDKLSSLSSRQLEFENCRKGECLGLSLSEILADYLEIDHYELSANFQSMLNEDKLKLFFEMEVVESGQVLIEAKSTASEIRFISHGLVELQIPCPHQRLQKISAGGVFGEIGFFLKIPQNFTAVALADTHFWKLSRIAFAEMQEKEPQLCVLVQNALLKSLCLQGSNTLNAQHH